MWQTTSQHMLNVEECEKEAILSRKKEQKKNGKGNHMRYPHIRRTIAYIGVFCLFLVAVAGVGGFPAPATHAQSGGHYFPETGYTVRTEFYAFWRAKGGVFVFGYPITKEYRSGSTGRITQYFERARFELVKGSPPSVALGRLGEEILAGKQFPPATPIVDTADRRYIPETQHIIQYGFKEIWETYGGVAIFGWPLSDEFREVLPNGVSRTVQYFEQARFEYWSELPPGQRVVLSPLGRYLAPDIAKMQDDPQQPTNEWAPTPTPIPQQPPQQPSQPPQQPPQQVSNEPALTIPAGVNATVTPQQGHRNTQFTLQATGFEPYEGVSMWLTAPSEAIIPLDHSESASAEGIVEEAISIPDDGDEGVWAITAEGQESGHQAIGYLLVSDSVASFGAGDPNALSIVLHDELGTRDDAGVVPMGAPQGTSFTLFATGFPPNKPDKMVNAWVTAETGESTPIDPIKVQVDEQGMVQARWESHDLPNGDYVAVVQEEDGDIVRSAPFRITSAYIAGLGTPRPPNINGTVTPPEGGMGTVFAIQAINFLPGEAVEFWITEPSGAYSLYPDQQRADNQGRIGFEPLLNITANHELSPGVYGFHFRGVQSQIRADVYCTYMGL
jgi:hypothetical protein